MTRRNYKVRKKNI